MVDRSEMDTAEFPILGGSSQNAPPRPYAPSVQVDVAALSNKGKVRDNNEDHYLVARSGRSLDTLLTNLPHGEIPDRFDEMGYAMMVADGMGGAQGGEVASRMAISTLVNIVLDVPDWIMKHDDASADRIMKRAAEYYQQIDSALTAKARQEPSLRGMGTTMTLAYSLGTDLFMAHVGDSRIYLFRDDALRQLTKDHTHAAMLAEAGVITHDEAASHRLRHVLTRAIGASPGTVETEVRRLQLLDGDRLLLCTDGLSDMVTDEEIGAILRANPKASAACHSLVQQALDAGGKDNVTVVVGQYRISEDPSQKD